ncbi:hypothetical protein HDV57DRAFT_406655 [Trichoderma longibrachiatum]
MLTRSAVALLFGYLCWDSTERGSTITPEPASHDSHPPILRLLDAWSAEIVRIPTNAVLPSQALARWGRNGQQEIACCSSALLPRDGPENPQKPSRLGPGSKVSSSGRGNRRRETSSGGTQGREGMLAAAPS